MRKRGEAKSAHVAEADVEGAVLKRRVDVGDHGRAGCPMSERRRSKDERRRRRMGGCYLFPQVLRTRAIARRRP
jgi:hypothetical protein